MISKNKIVVAGFVFHVLAAIFTVGYHQCDELFQVYEFAGYKLGINNAGEMPWEFGEQMRSGILPLLAFTITKLLHGLSVTNPFHAALFLRLLVALVSFFATKQLYDILESEISNQKTKLWLWTFALLFWCIPYFHARLSSENVSAALFMYTLGLALRALNQDKNTFCLIIAGVFGGLAFVCRFQAGFMLVGLFFWLLIINRLALKQMLFFTSGIILALVLSLPADYWMYGKWTISWWNYLYQNFFESKANMFGQEPFYFYFTEALLQLIPPFSLLIISAIVSFWVKFPKHVLTWITFPFVLLHFFVPHKELRFLFPIINFLPFIVLYFFQGTVQNKRWSFLWSKSFTRFAIITNTLLLLFFTIKPADETSQSLKAIYTVVKGENPVLYYEKNNPYSTQASLNYFRKAAIKPVLLTDTTINNDSEAYFFSENFNTPDSILLKQKRFVKIYSNYPAWMAHLNFNNWLNRAYCYSIYKQR